MHRWCLYALLVSPHPLTWPSCPWTDYPVWSASQGGDRTMLHLGHIHHHCTPQGKASAAEPPQAVVFASAPCKVVAPSNILSPGHVTTVETSRGGSVSCRTSRGVGGYPPVNSHPCPVTAMEAVCELSPCHVTARKAVYELSPCPVTALEAVCELSPSLSCHGFGGRLWALTLSYHGYGGPSVSSPSPVLSRLGRPSVSSHPVLSWLWRPSVSSQPCPVTARKAVYELSPCPVTAKEAVYELSLCPVKAMEAICNPLSCQVTAMETACDSPSCPVMATKTAEDFLSSLATSLALPCPLTP